MDIITVFTDNIFTNIHKIGLVTTSLNEEIILSKSLNFIPSPSKTFDNIDKTMINLDRWRIDTLRQLYFSNNKSTSETKPKFSKCKLKSSWIPSEKDFKKLDNNRFTEMKKFNSAHEQITTEIKELASQKKHTIQKNLSHNMRKSLVCLLKDSNRIIMPADKNVGITICTKEDYNIGILEQLNDKCFKKLTYRNHANAIAKKFLTNLKNICINYEIADPTANFIQFLKSTTFDEKYHIFNPVYALWKIHKPYKTRLPPMRLIVPTSQCYTKKAALLVDELLQPIVKNLVTVLPSSAAMLKDFKKLKIESDDMKFTTLDVSALYPSIPIDKGIAAVDTILNDSTITKDMKRHTKTLIIDLLTIVMHSIVVEFENQTYQQISGTAMGSTLAVVFANIYMYVLEFNALKLLTNQPIYYKRYIDDIIYITDQINSHILYQSLVSQDPINIKFTGNIAEDTCIHMDLELEIQDRNIKTSLHQKSINRYMYSPRSSFVPPHQRTAFISNEVRRYAINCSSIDDWKHFTRLFISRLNMRGYRNNLISDSILNLHYEKDRKSFFEQTNKQKKVNQRSTLVLQYNHFSNDIKEIIRKNWEKSELSIEKPRIAYTNAESFAFANNKANKNKNKQNLIVQTNRPSS
jgi:hypothetical protein